MSWRIDVVGKLADVKAAIDTFKVPDEKRQAMFEVAKPKLLALLAVASFEVTELRISASGSTHERPDPSDKTKKINVAVMAVTIEHLAWTF